MFHFNRDFKTAIRQLINKTSKWATITSCEKIDLLNVNMKMVSRCPPYTSERMKMRCTYPEPSVTGFVPVKVEGIFYKNIYCVKCHKVSAWKAKAMVNIYCPQKGDLGTKTVSWIMSNCTCDLAGTIQDYVPATIVRHFCPFAFRPCNNPMLAKYCHAFQEPVVSNAGISYRNAACAQCDGLTPDERLQCNPYRNIKYTPKSPDYPQWKFDFRGFYIDSVALKTPCQLRNNSRPYFRYVCEDKYNPSENRSSQYYTSPSFDEFGAQLVIPQNESVPNLTILSSTFRLQQQNHALCSSLLKTYLTRTALNRCMIKHIEPLDFLSSLDMLLTLHIPYDRDSSVHAVFLLNFEPEEPLPCVANSTLLLKRGFLAQLSDGSLAVQETLKGSFLLLRKYPVIIKVNPWHVSTKKGSPLPAWVLVCTNSNNRICDTATIQILPLDQEYKLRNILSLVGYTIISEEKATICIDGMNPTQILTIVAYSISLMCLLATLVKYCRTARMKTLPGKLMINLLLTLIVAHGSMLITSCFSLSGYTWPCLTLAIIQHYGWLGTFSWMGIMSFDICFSLNVILETQYNGRCEMLYRRYSLFGWLVPLMLVGICTGFTFLSTLPMGYDMYITCWLTGSSSMLYLLIVPMMIFLLGNICFFFGTVWQLKQLSANAADVGRNSGTQERLSICWKISSWSGGAWIFAIIGNVSSSNALMVCFMLLNAFQGIHIFLSFGLSRNVVACHRAVGGQQGYSNNPEGQITAHTQPVQETSLSENTSRWFSIIWCGVSLAMGLMDKGRSVV